MGANSPNLLSIFFIIAVSGSSHISIHDFCRYDGRDEAGAARDGVHDGENVARVVGRDVRDRQLKSQIVTSVCPMATAIFTHANVLASLESPRRAIENNQSI